MATRPEGCTVSQQSTPTSLNEQAQGDSLHSLLESRASRYW